MGRDACLAMGVILPDSSEMDVFSRPMGMMEGQYGYHGNDGRAFYAGSKIPKYGPMYPSHSSPASSLSIALVLFLKLKRYSTGDRIGCGVMSDGSVYFTLNGLWLGCSSEEVPKIAQGSLVCSIVVATGFDAHIKFIYESSLFMFAPDEEKFEVCFALLFSLLFSKAKCR